MADDSSGAFDRLFTGARQHKGDQLGALLELYRNYLRLLARTQIDLHLRGRLSPSDLVQETFLAAYRKFNQFRGTSEKELLGWLRRILVRTLAGYVQKQILAQKRDARREFSLEGCRRQIDRSSARFEQALLASPASPSAQAQRRELVAHVADRVARLPPDYREVIVLRNFEGLPFEEVAGRMSRSTGAVRALWLRALEKLRQMYSEDEA